MDDLVVAPVAQRGRSVADATSPVVTQREDVGTVHVAVAIGVCYRASRHGRRIEACACHRELCVAPPDPAVVVQVGVLGRRHAARETDQGEAGEEQQARRAAHRSILQDGADSVKAQLSGRVAGSAQRRTERPAARKKGKHLRPASWRRAGSAARHRGRRRHRGRGAAPRPGQGHGPGRQGSQAPRRGSGASTPRRYACWLPRAEPFHVGERASRPAEALQGVGGQRRAHGEALRDVATQRLEQAQRLDLLHAFRNDPGAEAVTDLDQRPHQTGIPRFRRACPSRRSGRA